MLGKGCETVHGEERRGERGKHRAGKKLERQGKQERINMSKRTGDTKELLREEARGVERDNRAPTKREKEIPVLYLVWIYREKKSEGQREAEAEWTERDREKRDKGGQERQSIGKAQVKRAQTQSTSVASPSPCLSVVTRGTMATNTASLTCLLGSLDRRCMCGTWPRGIG